MEGENINMGIFKKDDDSVLNEILDRQYVSFLDTIADKEQVWLIENEEGCYATIDENDMICLLIFAEKEDAIRCAEENIPAVIEIHDFADRCRELLKEPDQNINFFVYLSERGSMIVDPLTMLENLFYKIGYPERTGHQYSFTDETAIDQYKSQHKIFGWEE